MVLLFFFGLCGPSFESGRWGPAVDSERLHKIPPATVMFFRGTLTANGTRREGLGLWVRAEIGSSFADLRGRRESESFGTRQEFL